MPGLDNALELARDGFRVFPVHSIREGRCTCGNPACGSPGKHPRKAGWQQAASSDEAEVRAAFKPYPESNIGIATGQGLVVVDLDGQEGLDTLAAWERENGPIPITPQVRTGGGGLHLYFASDEKVKNSVRNVGPGVDIRSDGGFVVGPGSQHISGQSYAWIEGRRPNEM